MKTAEEILRQKAYLGSLGKGKPKTLTPKQRSEKRRLLAKARLKRWKLAIVVKDWKSKRVIPWGSKLPEKQNKLP